MDSENGFYFCLADVKYVDSHFHVWDLDHYSYDFPTKGMSIYRNYLPSDLWEEMKETPVKNAIFLQIINDGAEEGMWISRCSKNHQFIKGIVVGIDVQDPNLEETIKEMKAKIPKLVGVRTRHPDDTEQFGWLKDPKIEAAFAVIEKHELCFDLLITAPNFPDLVPVAKKYPKLKMVIDHLGKPNIKDGGTPGWEEGIKAAASCPNVYCKISGMLTEADKENWKVSDVKPYIIHALSQFGADRCMFGSDWPVCKLAHASYSTTFETVKEILKDLPPQNFQAVFGGTAAKFYGLKDLD